MILQALVEYYECMQRLGLCELAEFGFELKDIKVIIELKENGEINAIFYDSGDNARKYAVPKAVKRTSGIEANLFWDKAEYALGLKIEGKTDKSEQYHRAFVERIESLESEDAGILALRKFLRGLDSENLRTRGDFESDVFSKNPNVSFKVQTDSRLICERPVVQKVIRELLTNEGSSHRICLVTGEMSKCARLHPPIKGVWGAQSSGANIVSFNVPAFCSNHEERGGNAPVGCMSAFSYTESLNYLLRKGSQQRVQLGDASTVFWSADSSAESAFGKLFGNSGKSTSDDPNKDANLMKTALQAFKTGAQAPDSGDKRFYVLGLAPNASRISIRFWHSPTVREISQNICQHFEDLSIVHAPHFFDCLPLSKLLSSLCLKRETDSLPPNLAGEVVRSILDKSPYPYTMMSAAVRRCKAEQKVTYPRAAILKACLNRQLIQSFAEVKMALDKTNNDVPYLLGRWFAVLEYAQKRASPDINATIRDRYYSAVSTNPVTVFSTLVRLNTHHLSKIEKPGMRMYLEKLINEIMYEVSSKLPNHFSLLEQSCFAIGYYHQQQNFFKKKPPAQDDPVLSHTENDD